METSPQVPAPEKPKLAWYEQLWLGWPMLLVAIGGAIGGACGGAAWILNQKVFRKTRHPILRYVWTGLISVSAVLLYVVVVAIVYSYFPPQQ